MDCFINSHKSCTGGPGQEPWPAPPALAAALRASRLKLCCKRRLYLSLQDSSPWATSVTLLGLRLPGAAGPRVLLLCEGLWGPVPCLWGLMTWDTAATPALPAQEPLLRAPHSPSCALALLPTSGRPRVSPGREPPPSSVLPRPGPCPTPQAPSTSPPASRPWAPAALDGRHVSWWPQSSFPILEPNSCLQRRNSRV